jgi:hypothetical protein
MLQLCDESGREEEERQRLVCTFASPSWRSQTEEPLMNPISFVFCRHIRLDVDAGVGEGRNSRQTNEKWGKFFKLAWRGVASVAEARLDSWIRIRLTLAKNPSHYYESNNQPLQPVNFR